MLPVETFKPLIHKKFMPLGTPQPVTRRRHLLLISGTIAKDFALSVCVCVCRGVANVHEGRVPDKSRGISGQSAL
jgi:hypothetical protein